MARRWGFGDVTGETEKGGKKQYQHGHMEVSEAAARYATEEYPRESPAAAVGLVLASQVGGADLSEYVAPTPIEVDYEALTDALEAIDGVGEATAEEATSIVRAIIEGDDE